MRAEEFAILCDKIVERIRLVAPEDTGNLKYNGVRYEFIDANTCKFYVDESIAPYMPFTNEKWISPRWNGKKNPNEGWWTNGVYMEIIKTITSY